MRRSQMADMASSCWVESREGTGEMVKVRRGNTAEDCTATAAVAAVGALLTSSEAAVMRTAVAVAVVVGRCD